MTCSTCTEARAAPEHSRRFAQGCLYCAARRIQYLQRVLFKGESCNDYLLICHGSHEQVCELAERLRPILSDRAEVRRLYDDGRF